MNDDKEKKPGLHLRPVNKRGDKELPIMFAGAYQDTEENRKALGEMAQGTHGRFVITGKYERDAFQAESVDFIPTTDDRVIDEIWCPLVVEALKEHLRGGDPNEAIFHSGKHGSMTAQRVLEMLLQKDPLVLRFIEDVHGAALRVVRTRKRQPKRGPKA